MQPLELVRLQLTGCASGRLPCICFGDSSSLNGLSVVNQIDNYPLSRDAPGNALKKIEEPTKIIG